MCIYNVRAFFRCNFSFLFFLLLLEINAVKSCFMKAIINIQSNCASFRIKTIINDVFNHGSFTVIAVIDTVL